MIEILAIARDYASPVNTLVLLAGLYMLREVRSDVRDIKDNHLVHIYDRLGHLEGKTEVCDKK